LRSGPKKNYHFLGLGTLLSEQDFITFLGLALTMKIKQGDENINLVDSRHVGHALSPMKYLSHFQDEEEQTTSLCPYDFTERFASLRISRKPGYLDYPTVVAVL
jgi:hypothetical protein